MTPRAPANRQNWNHYTWWAFIGWMMVAVVVVLSVVSIAPPVPVTGGDKYEHALAYGVLMYWWGMLQPGRRWAWALALPALGIGMEFIQLLTPDRQMDWRDALANGLGVAVAILLLWTPFEKLLPWLDSQFPNRVDPGHS